MAAQWRPYGAARHPQRPERRAKQILKPKTGQGSFGSLRVPGCCLTKKIDFFCDVRVRDEACTCTAYPHNHPPIYLIEETNQLSLLLRDK
jgi:hypothetical protein